MNLMEWLVRNRITINYFAEKVGVDRSTIYRWRTGECEPCDTTMELIRKLSQNKVSRKEDLKDAKIQKNAFI